MSIWLIRLKALYVKLAVEIEAAWKWFIGGK